MMASSSANKKTHEIKIMEDRYLAVTEANTAHDDVPINIRYISPFAGNDPDSKHLTKREIECVDWYLKGKTAYEISLILKLSKRTIESHVENVKVKLNCINMAQLGYLVAAIKYTNLGYVPAPFKTF